MVRSGLSMFLNSVDDFELIGEAANGEEAVTQATALQPDVILMDLMMPVKNGVQAIGEITQRYPHIRIIALTSFKDDDLVFAALRAGAASYILKDATTEALAQAVRDAVEGRVTLAPEALQALLRATEHSRPRADLTEREVEILRLMTQGLTNNQIADALTLARSTVKFHVSNILSKLGAVTRTEAVALAVQQKLVD